jgi:hypothetical protein
MLIKMIMDNEGPNPDFDPPDPTTNPGAFHAYSVSPHVIVPVGSIHGDDSGGIEWVHCFPLSTNYIDPKTRKPVRGPMGFVMAEPYDDECKAAVAKQLVSWGAARGLNPEQAAALLAKAVAASKAQQEKNNPAPVAPATPAPEPVKTS